MHDPEEDEPVIERLQRRAVEDAARELPWEEVDVIAELRGDADPESSDAPPPDLSLGGYIQRHSRPPAFEGPDQQPYSVDLDVDETGDPARPYAAFLVFLRWAETGAGIMGHVESDDVAWGLTPDEAREAALALSLYDVRNELDRAFERRRQALED